MPADSKPHTHTTCLQVSYLVCDLPAWHGMAERLHTVLSECRCEPQDFPVGRRTIHGMPLLAEHCCGMHHAPIPARLPCCNGGLQYFMRECKTAVSHVTST